MTYTAESQGGNYWIVFETDDNGVVVKRHNVFCKETENTAEDAIALVQFVPTEN